MLQDANDTLGLRVSFGTEQQMRDTIKVPSLTLCSLRSCRFVSHKPKPAWHFNTLNPEHWNPAAPKPQSLNAPALTH